MRRPESQARKRAMAAMPIATRNSVRITPSRVAVTTLAGDESMSVATGTRRASVSGANALK
jgi:hypothetical protein